MLSLQGAFFLFCASHASVEHVAATEAGPSGLAILKITLVWFRRTKVLSLLENVF
jgi:hypothetical protein